MPAQQRLSADAAPGAQIHPRLIAQLELQIRRQRRLGLGNQREGAAVIVRQIIIAFRPAGGQFGPGLPGQEGGLQQVLRRPQPARQVAHADAAFDGDRNTPADHRFRQHAEQPRQHHFEIALFIGLEHQPHAPEPDAEGRLPAGDELQIREPDAQQVIGEFVPENADDLVVFFGVGDVDDNQEHPPFGHLVLPHHVDLAQQIRPIPQCLLAQAHNGLFGSWLKQCGITARVRKTCHNDPCAGDNTRKWPRRN